MAFVVQGKADADGKQVTISEETRIGALKSAVDLLDEGIRIVTIAGDGQIYTPTEFISAFAARIGWKSRPRANANAGSGITPA